MHPTSDDPTLDRALAAWAVRPEAAEARADAVVAAALAALDRDEARQAPRASWWRPVAGVALAASIALGALLLPGMRNEATVPGTPAVVVAANAPAAHAEAFSLLFTPTPEEEEYL